MFLATLQNQKQKKKKKCIKIFFPEKKKLKYSSKFYNHEQKRIKYINYSNSFSCDVGFPTCSREQIEKGQSKSNKPICKSQFQIQPTIRFPLKQPYILYILSLVFVSLSHLLADFLFFILTKKFSIVI